MNKKLYGFSVTEALGPNVRWSRHARPSSWCCASVACSWRSMPGDSVGCTGLGTCGAQAPTLLQGALEQLGEDPEVGWHLRSVLSQELTTEQAVELLLRCPLEASLDTEQGYPAHGLSANAWGLTTCWKPSSKT